MQHPIVPERNSKGEPTRKQTEADTPEVLRIQQLRGELWLERSLNHLGNRLNDCLVSKATQRSAGGSSLALFEPAQRSVGATSSAALLPAQNTALDLEGEIFQTLVMQLNAALDSGVALALPNISTSDRSQEPGFKVC